jgi:hypothetical protein
VTLHLIFAWEKLNDKSWIKGEYSMNFKSVIKTLLPSTTAVFGLLVMMSVSIYAQTVLVNYDFASAVAGNPCTASPLTTATGVTSTFTTGGTGGGTCTTPAGTAATSPPAFVANAANQSVSLTSFAAGSSNFFQFQLSGVSSYQDYALFFQSQRSGTGPVNADVQYSTNGTTFTTFQTVNPGNGVFAAFNIDLSTIAAIENQPTVYFRILGYGGTGGAGTFRIDNFQVRAIATPTAASVSVGGRVLGANNRPINRALVYLTDQNGETRTAMTNAFGYYRFQDVSVGQAYTINVLSKRYLFQPQVLTINEETESLNFLAQP